MATRRDFVKNGLDSHAVVRNDSVVESSVEMDYEVNGGSMKHYSKPMAYSPIYHLELEVHVVEEAYYSLPVNGLYLDV